MIAIDDIDVEYLKVRKDMLQLKKKVWSSNPKI